MLRVVALSSSLFTASAFAPVSGVGRANFASSKALEEPAVAETEAKSIVEEATSAPSPPPPPPRKSPALPFMMAPAILDDSLAADAGFDPLGFADCRENLLVYREAEVKHARLAMLAAAGWPLSELFQPSLAKTLGAASELTKDGRAPSVLNGFVAGSNFAFVLAAFAAVGVVEAATLNKQFVAPQDFDTRAAAFKAKEAEGLVSGDFGFDPLGVGNFFSSSDAGRKAMRTAELKNGRLAMLAITGFAIQEKVLSQPVVQETPVFFTPIWRIVAELMTGDALPPLYTQ